MTKILSARKWLIRTALSYLGTPYLWGGDDPAGFDCSGLVIECLKTAGLLGENYDTTANGLYQMYKEFAIDKPSAGALLFYMKKNNNRLQAYHVVICLDEYYQIGAGGGDSRTVSIKTAWNQNAFVKIRPINYNPLKMNLLDPLKKIQR